VAGRAGVRYRRTTFASYVTAAAILAAVVLLGAQVAA
jgi:hypothetical protein